MSDRVLRLLCGVVTLAIAIQCGRAWSDETDQFILPDPASFEDIGPYIDLLHYRALERVVDEMNAHVERALRLSSDLARRELLESLHSPERLAGAARRHLGQGWEVSWALQTALRSSAARRAYPDRRLLYRTSDWIYATSHFPLDPRRLAFLFPGPTVRVHGVLLGVDKIGHASDLGHLYFRSYRRHLRLGRDPDEALRRTLKTYTTGIVSERGIIGAVGTGVNSNADLASNYLGMKFYLNMTETVMLKGTAHPPLLVRIGDFWALNQHVRPESGFMAPFYSDHLNEALNPCIYERGMRGRIAKRLREERDRILALYADDDGRPRSRRDFERIAAELSTYYGEDYGHAGIDPVATIANSCFPEDEPADATASRDPPIR